MPKQQTEHQKLSAAPCAEEHDASLKCLDKNNYDRSKCVDYFERYKSCKKWEVETRAERRKLKDQADSKKK